MIYTAAVYNSAPRNHGRVQQRTSESWGRTMWLGESVLLSSSLGPTGPPGDALEDSLSVYPQLTATQVIGIDRVQLPTKLGENGKNQKHIFK